MALGCPSKVTGPFLRGDFGKGAGAGAPTIKQASNSSTCHAVAERRRRTVQGGGKRRSGNSATGMSVALTLVKRGAYNRLLIIGLLVMFTLPL